MPSRDRAQASDAELIACFAAGRDQRAFAELVARHGAMVRAVARRTLRDANDVDDAFQAAFLALARSASRVRWKNDVAGWLHQTTMRTAKAVRKRNAVWNKGKERQLKRPVCEPSELSAVELEELRRAIDEELRDLPTKLSTAIVLCDMEGLSPTETAARMGSPVSTLRDRLAQGRKQLRVRLERRGFVFSAAALATYSRVAGDVEAATVRETASAAARFASNQPTAATAPPAAALAEGVLQQMLVSKVISGLSLITACFVALVGASPLLISKAPAGIAFIETFDDGSLKDSSPVSWFDYYGSGSIELSMEGLRLASLSTSEIDFEVLDENYGDVSLRLTSMLSAGGVGVVAKSSLVPTENGVTGESIAAGFNQFGDLAVWTNSNSDPNTIPDPNYLSVAQSGSNLSGKLVHIQFDLKDTTFQLSVWPEGDMRPESPQLAGDIPSVVPEAGKIGFFFAPEGAADFGLIAQFEAVPELSSFGLATVGLGLLGVGGLRLRMALPTNSK